MVFCDRWSHLRRPRVLSDLSPCYLKKSKKVRTSNSIRGKSSFACLDMALSTTAMPLSLCNGSQAARNTVAWIVLLM